ncbi:MAG: hypothetical protein C5B54_06215, partial [Acidobacteria bacterium]
MKALKSIYPILFLLVFIVLSSPQVVSAQWCGFALAQNNPTFADQPSNEDNCEICPGVFPQTGNYTISEKDLENLIKGLLEQMVERTYNSQRVMDNVFGSGWSSNATMKLKYSTFQSTATTSYKEADVLMPNGFTLAFKENADGLTYTPPQFNHDTLLKTASGWDYTPSLTRNKYQFNTNGELSAIVDEFGNSQTFTYQNSRLTSISSSGKSLNFYYAPDGHIDRIQDSSNRTVRYTFNNQGALVGVTDSANRMKSYSYTQTRYGQALSQIKDHWGRVLSDITYDSLGRVSSQTKNGETYSYNYASSSQTLAVPTGYNATAYNYDTNGFITFAKLQNDGGYGYTYDYYPDGTLQQITDTVGVKTYFTYNANATIASIYRNYQGTGVTVRFDYAYDANFPTKVTSITPKNSSGGLDTNWQAWKFDYYSPGSTAPGALYHIYRVQNNGAINTLSTYAYNSAGQVTSAMDATGAATTFTYDPSTGDLLSTTYPPNSNGANPRTYFYGRDAEGRVTSTTDPI